MGRNRKFIIRDQSDLENLPKNIKSEISEAFEDIRGAGREIEAVFGTNFVKGLKNIGKEFSKEIMGLDTNQFTRPVKDMQPYNLFKKENEYIVVANTLGLAKEDVKIQLKKGNPRTAQQLQISGETKIDEINWNNKVNLVIDLLFEEEIVGISYTVKNGLTIVYIELEQAPEEQTITIKYKE